MTNITNSPETKNTDIHSDDFDPDFVQNEIIPLLMSDNAYKIVKWVVQYILPGLAFLYALIAFPLNIPYTDVVVSALMAVDWFLGIILGISTKQYYKYVAPKQ